MAWRSVSAASSATVVHASAIETRPDQPDAPREQHERGDVERGRRRSGRDAPVVRTTAAMTSSASVSCVWAASTGVSRGKERGIELLE